MENCGRQAVAGKRLASVHQQVSLQGASNVQTARTSEYCTDEAVENANPPEIPGPCALRFLTPKKRRATSAEYKAKKCPEPPRSTTRVTAPSGERLRDQIPGIIENESLRYQTSRNPRGGLDKLYDTCADEGGNTKPVFAVWHCWTSFRAPVYTTGLRDPGGSLSTGARSHAISELG
jgi:hypothetical protein